LTVEQKKEEDSKTLMIVIPAAIACILIIVSVIMIIRCFTSNKNKNPIVIGSIKTEVVDTEIEPQFVMENDDTKNIFARPSTTPMNLADAIEGSDAKNQTTRAATTNAKTRKAIAPNSKQVVMANVGDTLDDGFGNHGNFSASKSNTNSFNDSAMKPFRPTSGDSLSLPVGSDNLNVSARDFHTQSACVRED